MLLEVYKYKFQVLNRTLFTQNIYCFHNQSKNKEARQWFTAIHEAEKHPGRSMLSPQVLRGIINWSTKALDKQSTDGHSQLNQEQTIQEVSADAKQLPSPSSKVVEQLQSEGTKPHSEACVFYLLFFMRNHKIDIICKYIKYCILTYFFVN